MVGVEGWGACTSKTCTSLGVRKVVNDCGFTHNWMQDMRKSVFPSKTSSVRVRDLVCFAQHPEWCDSESGAHYHLVN